MTNKNGGKKRIMETNRFENHPNEQIQGSILTCTSVTLDESFQTLNIRRMPLEINSTCWGFFISWFWPWDQDSWGPNLVWHYLKAERLFSLCFWKFLVQTDPNKTKTIWLEQGCDTYPFYPHPFDTSTGAKSGKYLCWKDIFNPFCFVLGCATQLVEP